MVYELCQFCMMSVHQKAGMASLFYCATTFAYKRVLNRKNGPHDSLLKEKMKFGIDVDTESLLTFIWSILLHYN